jgi:hypothetical protein
VIIVCRPTSRHFPFAVSLEPIQARSAIHFTKASPLPHPAPTPIFGMRQPFSFYPRPYSTPAPGGEQHRATGYGILNFVSCCIGGLAAYLGGWLKERHVDLSYLLMGAGIGVLVCALLLILVKPRRHG